MFPSKYPILFILQTLAAAAVLGATCFAGIVLAQPLLFPLAIFGINMLPGFPVVREDGDDVDDHERGSERGEYDGRSGVGFSTP